MTVEPTKAAAVDTNVLAHVDAPGVVRVAGEESVGADLDRVGPDIGLVVAAVPAVRVGAHGSLLLLVLLVPRPFFIWCSVYRLERSFLRIQLDWL